MRIEGQLLTDPLEAPRHGWIQIEGSQIVEMAEGPPPHPADFGSRHAVISPGFYDAHTHLPQFSSIGCEAPALLPWLQSVIFPAEARWADLDFAAAEIRAAHRRMLAAGTVGYAGYLTSHPHGLDLVRDAQNELPIRAAVGFALMDRDAPDELLRAGVPPMPPKTELLEPTINPRFALSCSDELLDQAGRHAAAGLRVQTHLAEQVAECRLVAERFRSDADYTSVYDRFGLINERSLLAHAVHLNGNEWDLIAEREATVVHCPGANIFLRSGLFDYRAAYERGVRVALGSDVAAGPDIAMPRVARAMIEVAKARRIAEGEAAPLEQKAIVPRPADVWRIITEVNAEAIGVRNGGRLAAGSPADVLVLEPPLPFDRHLIGRLIYNWRDEFIRERIVAGRRIDPSRLAPASSA